jgi:hypothetical protein
MTAVLTLKTKSKPDYIPRRAVRKLAARASCDTDYALRTMFPPDSPARIRLQGRKRDSYIRAMVLEILGITDD